MAAYNGKVFELAFPDFTPRNVSSMPLSSNIRNNITPLPTDWENYSDRGGLIGSILNIPFNWTEVGASISVLNWPTRQDKGDDNNHKAPINLNAVGYDWFEKLHPDPSRIDLGAFSVISEDIDVYSSFRYEDQQLNNITLSTGAGTSIVNPPSFPTTHISQKSLSVTFQAIASGAAVINGTVTFNYVLGNVAVAVSGQRIIIFPWVPEDNIKEKLEWSTDIIKATNRESRRALRSAARITRSFRFYLSEEERVEFEKDAGNRSVLYTAPAWWDARRINDVSISDTTINLDTDYSEFENDGLVLFVEPESKVFEVKTIDSVNSGNIILNDGIENNFTTGFAVPVLPGVLINSNIKIHNQNHYFATVEIIATESFNRTAPTYSQLLGIDILEDRSAIKKTIPVSINRAGTLMDNKIGPVKFFAKENRSRVQEKFEWQLNGYQARSDLKDWLYSRFGRQKQFLYPTWQNDINIHTDDYLAGSGTLNVKTTALEAPFYFQVELNDGTTYMAECTSINKDVGFDTLTHNPPIVNGFTVAEVKYISKVRLMRNSSDSIEITYTNHNKTAAATNVVEI